MNQISKTISFELMNSLPIGMLFIDVSGYCKFVNAAFWKLFGIEDHQAHGKGWLNLFNNNEKEILKKLLRGQVAELASNTVTGKIFFRLTPTPFYDGLCCCTVEKINNNTNKDDKQQHIQQILDCTDAILYSADIRGRITTFNRAAKQAIQARKGVAIQIGDYWPDIISGDTGLDKERMEQLLRFVLAGNSYKTTEDILVGNGEKLTYSVQASPVFNEENQVVGAVLCAHNITVETRLQRESAEKALLRTQELEHWNQFYDMLISVLAHDLRQPLTTIILNADLVTHLNEKLPREDLNGIMDTLRNTSKKSMELMEGLLYWVESKKQDFTYKPEPINLYNLIEEANALFIYDQQLKGIVLQIEVLREEVVYAHYQMILFVLRNLISNATKYAFDNSIIIARADVSDKELTIIIQDSGKGMTTEQLDGLFSRKRSKVPSEKLGGAGMALTIAHEMIGKMNGRIRAESQPGKGTKFFLNFPTDILTT
ncbi:Signal transduction histidine kinase [bacterium A37T11]|nr:Signal transduction histidine kinase [bacterium A37T11]